MKSDFTNIDASGDPYVLVKNLEDINRQSAIKNYKRQSFDLLEASSGQSIIDIGCGIGEDTRRLADTVGPLGHALGIDKSSAMIDEAQRRFGSGDLGQSLSFRVCAAEKLPFPDSSFDRALVDRTLQHVDDPLLAIHEVYRVLKSSGRIVVIEPDWHTILFDTSDFEMGVRFSNFMADSFVRNGKVGRSIARLAREVGFTEVKLLPVTTILRNYDEAAVTFALNPALEAMIQASAASEIEVARFRNSLNEASKSGAFLGTLAGFIYVGFKP